MLDIFFLLFEFFSIKIPLLDHRPPLTSTTSEETRVIFSKNTFLKSVHSKEKDEGCLGFLEEIFTKSVHRGGVYLSYPFIIIIIRLMCTYSTQH